MHDTDTAIKDAASVAEQPTDEAPPPEPAAAAEQPPAHQTVIGHPIPVLSQSDIMWLEFVRDFVQGVPYAVDAVNAAKAG